jgi:hypothetical protein
MRLRRQSKMSLKMGKREGRCWAMMKRLTKDSRSELEGEGCGDDKQQAGVQHLSSSLLELSAAAAAAAAVRLTGAFLCEALALSSCRRRMILQKKAREERRGAHQQPLLVVVVF